MALAPSVKETPLSELRQDPVTRDWVIVNPERARRPKDDGAAPGACPFCPGNESLTPAAVDSLVDPEGRWLVRVVPNRYPALSSGQSTRVAYERTAQGWHWLPGYGQHEVIVEVPEHGVSLVTMEQRQLRRVVEMYVRRYRALARQPLVHRRAATHYDTRRLRARIAHRGERADAGAGRRRVAESHELGQGA